MSRRTPSGPTPDASSLEARERMVRQKQKDTEPELAVRRAVHALGLRYRVNRAPIHGMRSRADIVFPTEKVAVFVDGCFWHGCPQHGTSPKSHSEWWQQKIETNKERDRRTNEQLETAGWTVIRIWEHEKPEVAAQRVREAVLYARENRASVPNGSSHGDSK